MKIRRTSYTLSVIYGNYWYILLFGILIGMKLYVLMVIINSNKLNQKSFLNKHQSSLSEQNILIRNYSVMKRSLRTKSQLEKKVPKESPRATISPKLIKEWFVLANLENSTIELSSKNRTNPEGIWLIFNQIPNCSGEFIVELLIKMSDANNFIHQTHEYRTPWNRFLLEQEQENLVNWFEYQHLPKSYDRHFYFVNFTFFQRYIKEDPIYINMIQDPVIRLKNEFKAKRVQFSTQELGNGTTKAHKLDLDIMTFENCVLLEYPECAYENGTQDYTMSVPFFCGQHPNCVLINNRWAVQRAKFVIEKYYSVVGVVENLHESILVFEKYIPKFFEGASNIISGLRQKLTDSITNINSNNMNESKLSYKVREILKKKLPNEFELYKFILQRLQLQFLSQN